MTHEEFDNTIKDISQEAIDLLNRTGTPALPPYYMRAFVDVLNKRSVEIEEEVTKHLGQFDQNNAGKTTEESLDFARLTLHEYGQTTSKLKDIVLDKDAFLDLKKLESDPNISVSIIDELKAHYSGISTELKKAESTLVELENSLEKIEMGSFIDPLTRLRTPILLKRQLTQILEAGFNRNLDLWVALMKIDNYDQLKEENGYLVMEKIILFITKSLQGTVRSDNHIYRYNDQPHHEHIFCVVFNRMDKQGAYLAVDRVRSRVEASRLVYAQKVINITVSATIVTHQIADTAELLCARADKALSVFEGNNVIVANDLE